MPSSRKSFFTRERMTRKTPNSKFQAPEKIQITKRRRRRILQEVTEITERGREKSQIPRSRERKEHKDFNHGWTLTNQNNTRDGHLGVYTDFTGRNRTNGESEKWSQKNLRRRR